MRATDPHFLLFSEALGDSASAANWRFVLQPVGSDNCLAVSDAESGAPTSRLELLAVVRGLEALDQPSHVTLLTGSRYVIRGIRRGLCQWRERRWRWERFGQLVPIRDFDLWQRVDRALEFHRVECCEWRSEEFLSQRVGDKNAVLPAAKAASPELVPSAVTVSDGPAVLIVQREAGRRMSPRRAAFWRRGGAMEHIWRGVSAQIASFCRPAFTRAA